jgi:hypothetical protein
MHAVYSCGNILLLYQVLVKHFLNEYGCGYTPIGIIRNISILRAYEELITALPVFANEGLQGRPDGTLTLLASIIDSSVEHIDASAHYH